MIRFSRYIWLYFLISACVLVPGIYSLLRYGLKPSVDFTGGTVLQFSVTNDLTKEEVAALAGKDGIELTTISQPSPKTFSLQMKPVPEKTLLIFEGQLLEASDKSLLLLQQDTVGPILGKELMEKTVVATILAVVAILLYVAYAFRNIKFGVSAVVALIHDTLVMFGVFSLLGYFFGVEVDTLFVTAFLTTMSFSVHDTIVIFDRIREYRRRDSKTSLDVISDIALTQTMGRSVTNSFTIIFMLLSLVLMGGDTIHWFAVALLVGTITGTYSSPFVATPVLILWDRWEKRKKSSG